MTGPDAAVKTESTQLGHHQAKAFEHESTEEVEEYRADALCGVSDTDRAAGEEAAEWREIGQYDAEHKERVSRWDRGELDPAPGFELRVVVVVGRGVPGLVMPPLYAWNWIAESRCWQTPFVTEGFVARVREAVQGLTPGYFALVMATGILSVGMHLEGFDILSTVLLGVCCASFVVLLALTGWRLVGFRSAVVEDFTDPRRGFGFFTFVAGTNVLGVRLGLAGFHEATAVLLVVAGLAWVAFGYVVPWTAVLGRQERPVLATANGTWFIWVVASQSVAVAAATIEPVFDSVRRELAVLAIMSWSVGVFLYGATGLLVSLRLMLYEFGPEELTPPYWVSMGALAITVLAGARIVEMADAPMVTVTRDLIAGLAVVFWAFATWLIPVLVAAGWWRHVRRRVPLRYEATLWSIIFPLGMYAVAGIYLGRADDLPVVEAVGSAELWVAFAACVLVFAAMVLHLIRTVIAPARPQTVPRG